MNRVRDEYNLQQQNNSDQPLLFRYFQPKANSSNDRIRIKENDTFLQDQSLIDCLIRMGSSSLKRKILTNFCQNYYRRNPFELLNVDKFLYEYSPVSSLSWYRKSYFTYRLLNKALYTSHIDVLILLQFFMHDLGCELAKKRCSSEVRVYRNHWMTKSEIQMLENSINDFISINTFLSTSNDRDHIQQLLHSSESNQNMEKVILEIIANPNLIGARPFGEVNQDHKSSANKLILFMVGSIFRVKSIQRSEDGIWHVHLVLASVNDKHLKPLLDQLKKRFDDGPTNYLHLGYFLNELKSFDAAEKAFRRHLNQLPSNHPEMIDCYRELGHVARREKDYDLSLKWYETCLNLMSQMESIDHSKIIEVYQEMGHMYQDKGDYVNAKKLHEQALESTRTSFGDQHSLIIVCLASIGDVYRRENNYQEAELHYRKALKLLDNMKMVDHSRRALIIRGIARIHEARGDFDEATKYFKQALNELQSKSSFNPSLSSDIQKDVERVSDKRK